MAKWTEGELAALDEVSQDTGMAAYHRFGVLTNYSRSYNAFEVKRRRQLDTNHDSYTQHNWTFPPTQPTPVIMKPTQTFVGFTMAYWDLETTFSTQPIVLCGAIADQFGQVTSFRKGRDITDDKDLVHKIALTLSDYDIWVTWYGKLFDVPVLNARLRYHGLKPLPLVKHVDAIYYATGGSMKLGRRSLESVSEYFDVPNRKTPLSVKIWDKAMAGDEGAYNKIVEHCEADVLSTRDVFNILKTQVSNIHR